MIFTIFNEVPNVTVSFRTHLDILHMFMIQKGINYLFNLTRHYIYKYFHSRLTFKTRI